MGDKKDEHEVIAYHEAGHLVSSCKMGLSHPKFATIEPDDEFRVRVQFSEELFIDEKIISQYPGMVSIFKEYTELQVIRDLSGYVAEMRHSGVTRSDSVLKVTQEMATGPTPGGDLSDALHRLARFEPDNMKREKLLLNIWERTWEYVGKWWDRIEWIANILIEKKKIDPDELNVLMGKKCAKEKTSKQGQVKEG